MIKNYEGFLNEIKGYAKSGEHFFSSDGLTMPPKTNDDWLKLFKRRCEQLQKDHPRSEKVVDVIGAIEELLGGGISELPYNDLATSTAGYQWGKEFADQLGTDELLVVKKIGNKVVAVVNPELNNDDFMKSFKVKAASKKFGL